MTFLSTMDLSTFFSCLAQMSITQLAISITLIAIIPTFIELSQVNKVRSVKRMITRDMLYRVISKLKWIITFSGVNSLGSTLGILFNNQILAVLVILLFVICLLLLLISGRDMVKEFTDTMNEEAASL